MLDVAVKANRRAKAKYFRVWVMASKNHQYFQSEIIQNQRMSSLLQDGRAHNINFGDDSQIILCQSDKGGSKAMVARGIR